MSKTAHATALTRNALFLGVGILLAGCLQATEIDAPSEASERGGGEVDGGISEPQPGRDAGTSPGPLEFEAASPVLPRLTASQYRNTVLAIFGPDVPDVSLESDTNPNLFYSIGATSTDISALGIERYAESADVIASHVLCNVSFSSRTRAQSRLFS